MPSPSSVVVEARKALALRLKNIRKDAGLTGEELSARCRWGPAKTSRIQSATRAVSESDIRLWCIACGAEDQIPDLIAAARAVESMYTEWRQMERTGLRAAQESVETLYEHTRLLRVYASRVLPGMVQTREYTAAVLCSIQRDRGVAVDDVDAAVEARMERQKVLSHGRCGACGSRRAAAGRGDAADGCLDEDVAVCESTRVEFLYSATGRARRDELDALCRFSSAPKNAWRWVDTAQTLKIHLPSVQDPGLGPNRQRFAPLFHRSIGRPEADPVRLRCPQALELMN
ncbi:Scr1 family TA system antitoxin-like transcriptional regulator [Streptomyces sp. NPDC055103]